MDELHQWLRSIFYTGAYITLATLCSLVGLGCQDRDTPVLSVRAAPAPAPESEPEIDPEQVIDLELFLEYEPRCELEFHIDKETIACVRNEFSPTSKAGRGDLVMTYGAHEDPEETFTWRLPQYIQHTQGVHGVDHREFVVRSFAAQDLDQDGDADLLINIYARTEACALTDACVEFEGDASLRLYFEVDDKGKGSWIMGRKDRALYEMVTSTKDPPSRGKTCLLPRYIDHSCWSEDRPVVTEIEEPDIAFVVYSETQVEAYSDRRGTFLYRIWDNLQRRDDQDPNVRSFNHGQRERARSESKDLYRSTYEEGWFKVDEEGSMLRQQRENHNTFVAAGEHVCEQRHLNGFVEHTHRFRWQFPITYDATTKHWKISRSAARVRAFFGMKGSHHHDHGLDSPEEQQKASCQHLVEFDTMKSWTHDFEFDASRIPYAVDDRY